jgi:glucose/arabinose dehydrogenase
MNPLRHLLLCVVIGAFTVGWPSAAAPYDLAAWLRARVAPADVPLLESSSGSFRVEIAAEGLESPWAVVPTPDGRVFITERPGRLRVFQHGALSARPVAGVPRVAYHGQGGLLDMVLHPDYPSNRMVYLCYTVDSDAGMMTRAARAVDTAEGLKHLQVVFAGFPGGDKPKHFGCRIRFGIDRKLYITLGERGEGRRAQDLMDLNGKTLRLNDDGTVPADNPFAGRRDARPEIFSYGNRNSQGMAVQPGTGLIFQTEHGPSWNDAPGGGDEVNLIVAGGNYGWPLVHHRDTREGTLAPLAEYTPAIAPAGCTFYTGDAFPAWRGDFFFATLVGKTLIRLKLDGPKAVGQEHLLKSEFGRLRDVAQGADGSLYLITSDTDAYGPGRPGGDRLLRLVPAAQ